MARDESANPQDTGEPPMRMICPACNRMHGAGEFVCGGCGSGLLEIPDAPLLSGGVIDDRYDVEGVVGTGGMGTVYRARQRGMEREVAIKVLHPHYAHQPRAVKRFFREAQAASRLVHPNIVTVFDFGRSGDGDLYMVMELLEGWTLGDLVHYRAPVTPALAIAVAVQICDALEEAHRRRLVHRDLKPDNVLLTTVEEGLWAKVLDFGIARVMRDPESALTVNQSTVEIAGTPSYMSPEQILGKEPDPRSDLYALGIILFEMLTKRRPFDDESSVALCMKQLSEEPPRVSSLVESSSALDEVVARLLAKQADARPQHARDVRALLLACPEAGAPFEVAPLEPRAARALTHKTTRADAALMMVQPTLDASSTPGRANPALGAVLDRARAGSMESAAALSGLASLRFVEFAEPASSAPGGLDRARAIPAARPEGRRRRVTAIAQVLVEHPTVLKSGLVARWLDDLAQRGVAVSLEAQKAVLRAHGTDADEADSPAGLVGALVALQADALRANVALRAGAAPVDGDHGVADALDLSRRLAAAGAHGVVTVPRGMALTAELDARPQSAVFLPNGVSVECVAIRPHGAGADDAAGPTTPALLWGRSMQLRRLGQLADEARRAGPVCVALTGGRGLGRTAVVKSFASGRTHLYVRVAPGASAWPGHVAAALVGASLGRWPLTGLPNDLDDLEAIGRDRELLELLLGGRAAAEPPTVRELARLIVDHLARYAGDGPLAVVIDDVHLLDRASHELLEAAVALADGRPWCFVATSRWLKPGMFLADAQRVDLRPLSLRASNSVLEALGVGPRQRHAAMACAQGNPLALHLLARALAEGRPVPAGDPITALLPEVLRGAAPADADRAWVAASLGDPMADDFATQAARLYLESDLGEALTAWLADRLRRVGPIPGALGERFAPPTAAAACARAERCERLGLWRLAALEYESAAQLVPDDERGQAQLRAAHNRARAGDVRGAIATWEVCARAGAARQRPTELLAFAGALIEIGEQARAADVLDEVGGYIDPGLAPRSFAEALALKARAAVRRGELTRAMTWLNEARVATDRLKRTDARAARALDALTQEIRAEIAVAEGDRDTARVNLRQARDAFRDLGRHGDALRCLNDLGRLELEGELTARAADTFRAASRLAAASGLGREVFRAEVGLGEALAGLGEVDEGTALLRRSLRRAGDADEEGGLALAAVAMGRVLVGRALFADAVRHTTRARSTTASARVIARAAACEGAAWAGQGQGRKAARAYAEAIELASACGDGLLRRQVEALAAALEAPRPRAHDEPPPLPVAAAG